MKNLFLTNRFFYGVSLLILCMLLSYPFPFLFAFAKTAGVLYAVIAIIDVILLYNKSVNVVIKRETPSVLSLGDDNADHYILVEYFRNKTSYRGH